MNSFKTLIVLLLVAGHVRAGVLPTEIPPVQVHGPMSSPAEFTAEGKTIRVRKVYDVVIVGGGPAGLSAAKFLSDKGKSVLLLERFELGGLASGSVTTEGYGYDRGSAYWSDANDEEMRILENFGFGDYRTNHAIEEPIDSYLWNGQFYRGIWEKETLEKLPASFALFKFVLERAGEEGRAPNQPIENAEDTSLDKLTAREWINAMPDELRKYAIESAEAKEILHRFEEQLSSGDLNKDNPMQGVIGLMDIYCRSALGAESDLVSALAFANFYISEIVTRYTTPLGTGAIAQKVLSHLKQRAHVTIKEKAQVEKIVDFSLGATVTYVQKKRRFEVAARYVVYAGQIGNLEKQNMLWRWLEGSLKPLREIEPKRAEVLKNLEYSHYLVHSIFVEGHPYRETYDTWVRDDATYSQNDFTDIILGRWVDKKINGYLGIRDFSRDPDDTKGIFTIYQALPVGAQYADYTVARMQSMAQSAAAKMFVLLEPFMRTPNQQPVQVTEIKTNRWPASIHIARPGHFQHLAKILRPPFGHVYFANNNLGTPSFEEALFRGHCAANNILKKLDKSFRFEPWTHCQAE